VVLMDVKMAKSSLSGEASCMAKTMCCYLTIDVRAQLCIKAQWLD
jgi:hypothetical protein